MAKKVKKKTLLAPDGIHLPHYWSKAPPSATCWTKLLDIWQLKFVMSLKQMEYMCDICVRWTAGHLQRSSRMWLNTCLRGALYGEGFTCRKLISSNMLVLTWFIEKMAALKSYGFFKMSQKSSPIPTHSDNGLVLFAYVFILKEWKWMNTKCLQSVNYFLPVWFQM